MYGFVPDKQGKRIQTFLLMFVFSSSHILMKQSAIALLAVVSPFYLGIYFLADTGLFLFYKLVRRDFTYWINIPSQAKSILISCVARVVLKCVVDFTALLQGRHPFEMGGLYWVANLFLAQASCYVFAYLYVVSDASNKLSPETVWGVIVALQVIFLFSFGRFLTIIKSEYLSTFLGTVRGCDYNTRVFNDSETTDYTKFSITADHPQYYASIRGLLRIWLADNWQRFLEEKPEWFVRLAPQLPPDLIPRGANTDLRALSSIRQGLSGLNREGSVKSLRLVRLSITRRKSSSGGKIGMRAGSAAGAELGVGMSASVVETAFSSAQPLSDE